MRGKQTAEHPSRVGTEATASPSKSLWTTKSAKRCGPRVWDPDDPAVVAALDLVAWALSLGEAPRRNGLGVTRMSQLVINSPSGLPRTEADGRGWFVQVR
jgi:hypothetical protein